MSGFLISRLVNARAIAYDRLPDVDIEAIDDAIAALVRLSAMPAHMGAVMNDNMTSDPPDPQRTAFESWFGRPHHSTALQPMEHGRYLNPMASMAWDAWQAAVEEERAAILLALPGGSWCDPQQVADMIRERACRQSLK